MPHPDRFTVQCFVCRQVRTEAAEWADRPPPPGVRVSHAICPPCLAAHYPEVKPLVNANELSRSAA